MKRILALAAIAALAVAALQVTGQIGVGATSSARADAPVNVIVDLDIEADVDDVGALDLLHTLADNGEANILGIAVDTSSTWGPQAVDAINTYHGRPNIPIGQWKGATFDPVSSPGNYTQALATEFPQDLGSGSNAENATTMMRRLLAAQPDDSVVVVGIGFLNNLRALLNSGPDSYSSLSGTALVDLKVKTLSLMGGYYPNGIDGFNWWYDRSAAAGVINGWPGQIIFSGLGGSVGTGPRLATETPVTNPGRRAFAIFPGASNTRPSWDQIATLVAVRGLGSLFGQVTGKNTYNQTTGENVFTTSPNVGHSYLTQIASNSALATVIEDLMVRAPGTGGTGLANGVYKFTAQHSGKVADVNGCSSTGAVQQWAWLNNNCQKWRLTAVGGGYYKVESIATAKVMDVWQANTANGASVVQWSWLNGSNQKWAITSVGGGYYKLVNQNSGLVLEVPGASTSNGVALTQYSWLSGTNQKWQVTYLSP